MGRQPPSWHAARGTRHVALALALAAVVASGAEWKVPREYRRPVIGGGEADTVVFTFNDGGHLATGSVIVADEQDNVLPFRVLASKHGDETSVAYSGSKAKGSVHVYYGGAGKTPVNLSVVPAGNWQPKLSLLLTTMRCPGGALESHKPIQAVAKSGESYGQGFVDKIFHGVNPFGRDDFFASYYVGYLNIEKPGRYRIYTASSEASYVLLDGKVLCQWPGHHDPHGGRNGQHGADIQLNKGEYKIEYFHAKTQGDTCMMLGWTPPGEKGWHVVPESAYLHTPTAKADAPERRGNAPLAAFVWTQEDQLLHDRKADARSAKPDMRATKAEPPPEAKAEPKPEPADLLTFTHVRFRSQCRNVPEKARIVWDYGDASASTGDGREHIYVGEGPFTVAARIVGEDGKTLDSYSAAVPMLPMLKNFTILDKQAVGDYVDIIARTDCSKVPATAMDALWELVETSESIETIKPFVETYANRFGAKGKAWHAADRLALAVSVKEPERALKIYAALVADAPTKLDAARIQMERIEIVLHKLKSPEKALDLARAILRTRSGLEDRIAAVKIGDVYRAQGDFEKAEAAYRDAQKITYAEMDRRVVAVRQGGYLETVWSHIQSGELRAAREGLVTWEIEHPIGKLSGDLILMTARYFDKIGEPDRALAELETLVKLNPLTPYLPDVTLLMARAHRKLGNPDKARELIQKVLDEFPKSRAAQQAIKEK